MQMRDRLNAEGHDESQYLPKEYNAKTGKMERVPPINAFRAAKGDITRNEDDKLESVHWLPRIMHRQRQITKEHYDTARSFERHLIHARRTLGICDIKGKLFDIMPANGIDESTDLFLTILRSVARPEVVRLVWFVDMNFPCSSAALPDDMLGVIQHGLENVQKIIDLNNETRNNTESTLPELSLKSPRPENP